MPKFFCHKNKSEIIRLIEDCCYRIASMEPKDDQAFVSSLKIVVDALKDYFTSEYCAIGKVDGMYVEESYASVSQFITSNIEIEKSLKNVKRVSLGNNKYYVCQVLNDLDIDFKFYGKEEIGTNENSDIYINQILPSHGIRNTTIIVLKDKKGINKGYIQIINSQKAISPENIEPFRSYLSRLIIIIQRRDESREANLFKDDYNFFLETQKNIHTVDKLLEQIMKYFSTEFSAGIITFRIPLLVGIEKKPLFFLRKCYINPQIEKDYSVDRYSNERLIKTEDEMGGYEHFTCTNTDKIITHEAKDSSFYTEIKDQSIHFHKHTIIIPIVREYTEKNDCVLGNNAKCASGVVCPDRFAKYFGIFKLRILNNKKNDSKEDYSEWYTEETEKRLSFLAKHISILLNAIVDKYENNSLNSFQEGLKRISFTQIKEFDKQCSEIVKNAIHTRMCAIYRFDSLNGAIRLSASTHIKEKYTDIIRIQPDLEDTIKDYRYSFDIPNRNGIIGEILEKKKPVYYITRTNDALNSIMIVPMIRKDNSEIGVMLLVGKDQKSISKTFWEHDKKHIEFIVDILTRIEETESERFTFLSRLSHELLTPITEMVYINDYHMSTANRDSNAVTKKFLIKTLGDNLNMCMTFKYIIEDVEYIYSLSNEKASYNFMYADLKDVIIQTIRLFEDEAINVRGLVIKTQLTRTPDKMYIDKSRMMQVIINLLRNAIQYSNYGDEISIRYDFNSDKNVHEIDFYNNGIGVKEDEKDKIFELLYRSEEAKTKVPNGSGIGLYLVRQIMRKHGGDCYVKALTYPTIFTIQIPNK